MVWYTVLINYDFFDWRIINLEIEGKNNYFNFVNTTFFIYSNTYFNKILIQAIHDHLIFCIELQDEMLKKRKKSFAKKM